MNTKTGGNRNLEMSYKPHPSSSPTVVLADLACQQERLPETESDHKESSNTACSSLLNSLSTSSSSSSSPLKSSQNYFLSGNDNSSGTNDNKCGLEELSLNSPDEVTTASIIASSSESPSSSLKSSESVCSQEAVDNYNNSAPSSPKVELSLFTPAGAAFSPYFPSSFPGAVQHPQQQQHPVLQFSHPPLSSNPPSFYSHPHQLLSCMMDGDPLNRPLVQGSASEFCCEWTTGSSYSSPMREMEG